MARNLRQALFGSIQFLLLATCANAQSVTDTLRDFGLLGTWAVECNQLPSPGNEHAIFALTSIGTVQLRNDFGIEYDEMIYRIVAANQVGADKLALRQVLVSDSRIVLDNVMLKNDERVRMWSSRGADGTTLVWDGVVPMTNGHETRWTARCQGRWTGGAGSVSGIKFDPSIDTSGKIPFDHGQ